jgi:hypothetical protein
VKISTASSVMWGMKRLRILTIKDAKCTMPNSRTLRVKPLMSVTNAAWEPYKVFAPAEAPAAEA